MLSNMRVFLRQLARVLPLLGSISCGSPTVSMGPKVLTVTVTPNSTDLFTGGRQQFSATLRDADGAMLIGRTIKWSSDNAAVASVDSSTGLATAITTGTATITALSERKAGSATVSVVGTGFVAITAGVWSTCGLTLAGAAYCWGQNRYGELGDGTATERLTPVAVQGGHVFTSLTASGMHACGLTTTGEAYCWGTNDGGELGDGTGLHRTTPTRVQGGLSFTALSAGSGYTCGLAGGVGAYCWGSGFWGQLGDGMSTQFRSTPAAVLGSFVLTILTPGSGHTCGVVSGGAVYCWGDNRFGQLGDGTTVRRFTPVAVLGGQGYTSLTAGMEHTCGLTRGGIAYCWGRNTYGTLGDGTTADRQTPVAVQVGRIFTDLEAGERHTCGLSSQGVAYCWGANALGQLGQGPDIRYQAIPTAVQSATPFTALTAGANHTCGLTNAGAVYCWGDNYGGQIGDGTKGNRRLVPVAVILP